jgi:hypothetical protein
MLEEVVDAFESWRANRTSKNEPIPDRLWDMAKTLISDYKKAHIQRALRVSGSQFNKRCLNLQSSEDSPIKDGFVSGILDSVQNKDTDEHCELTLKGNHKSLHIKVSIKQLAQILPLMEGCL